MKMYSQKLEQSARLSAIHGNEEVRGVLSGLTPDLFVLEDPGAEDDMVFIAKSAREAEDVIRSLRRYRRARKLLHMCTRIRDELAKDDPDMDGLTRELRAVLGPEAHH